MLLYRTWVFNSNHESGQKRSIRLFSNFSFLFSEIAVNAIILGPEEVKNTIWAYVKS